jgi:hypothetical protein
VAAEAGEPLLDGDQDLLTIVPPSVTVISNGSNTGACLPLIV